MPYLGVVITGVQTVLPGRRAWPGGQGKSRGSRRGSFTPGFPGVVLPGGAGAGGMGVALPGSRGVVVPGAGVVGAGTVGIGGVGVGSPGLVGPGIVVPPGVGDPGVCAPAVPVRIRLAATTASDVLDLMTASVS